MLLFTCFLHICIKGTVALVGDNTCTGTVVLLVDCCLLLNGIKHNINLIFKRYTG